MELGTFREVEPEQTLHPSPGTDPAVRARRIALMEEVVESIALNPNAKDHDRLRAATILFRLYAVGAFAKFKPHAPKEEKEVRLPLRPRRGPHMFDPIEDEDEEEEPEDLQEDQEVTEAMESFLTTPTALATPSCSADNPVCAPNNEREAPPLPPPPAPSVDFSHSSPLSSTSPSVDSSSPSPLPAASPLSLLHAALLAQYNALPGVIRQKTAPPNGASLQPLHPYLTNTDPQVTEYLLALAAAPDSPCKKYKPPPPPKPRHRFAKGGFVPPNPFFPREKDIGDILDDRMNSLYGFDTS